MTSSKSPGVAEDGLLVGAPLKRAADITIAGAAALVLLPVFVACAVLVRITSGGPVIFGHRRCGEGGRRFQCLKFRTMVTRAEELLDDDDELRARYVGNGYKLPRSRDPRVTRVGHVLRYTHLDELPQLINVLRGDMSLVGPRPVIEEELKEYGQHASELLSVRPGVFGPWTALGKDRPAYPERVDIELSYVRDQHPFKDLRILARNVPVLLWGQTDE